MPAAVAAAVQTAVGRSAVAGPHQRLAVAAAAAVGGQDPPPLHHCFHHIFRYFHVNFF